MAEAALDPLQVQAALRAVDPDCTLREIVRPDGGLTGAVWLLRTDDRDYILRTFPPDTASWKPEKESIVYGLLRRQAIPVPEIVAIDLSCALLPCAYAISVRLPGETLSRAYAHLSEDERTGIYRQLGDCAGRMHSLAFSACGDLGEREGAVIVGPASELSRIDLDDRGPFLRWADMHHRIVQNHLSFLQNTEFADMVDSVRVYFSRHAPLLATDIIPCLLHMDLHCGNILVSGGRITGILDVEESLVGHNEFDLMRTELAHFRDGDPEIAIAFSSAYGEHIRLPHDYNRRKNFYELSRSLVGLRCIAAYGERYAHSSDADKQSARARIQFLLSAEE